MADREKVIRGLERFIDDFKPFCGNRDDWQRVYDALALLKEQELEIKGLRKLVEWAVECDFGYDNLGDWWVDRFKSEIEDMSYTEGLIHLAKRYVEVFDGGDKDD